MLKILAISKNLLSHGGKSRVWDFVRTLNAGAVGGNYNNTNLCKRATFCSGVEDEDEDDLPTEVIALPLMHKPLFPSSFEYVTVEPNLEASIWDRELKSSSPVVGGFLLKYLPGTNSGTHDLKGEALYNCLHKVGTLAEIIGNYGGVHCLDSTVLVLAGLRRIQITKMVNEDPLTVKVNYLEDKPYDKNDARQTSDKIITALRNIGKMTCERMDRALLKHITENDDSSLAFLGAATSGMSDMYSRGRQEVLETLHVPQRLEMALNLLIEELDEHTLLGSHEWTLVDDGKVVSERLSILLQQRGQATNKVK